MNFMMADLSIDGTSTVAKLDDGTTLTLARQNLPAGRYELGIRPENVRVAAGVGATSGTADVVENLGDRKFIYVNLTDGARMIVLDSGKSTIRPGDTVPLEFDADGVHVFNESGQSLTA